MRLLLPFAAALAAAPAWAAEPPSADAAPSQRAYRSAFADYRNFKDEPVGSWREANDEMGRVGGHAGHTSHSGMPASPPPQEKQGDAKSGSDHAGHHGGGQR